MRLTREIAYAVGLDEANRSMSAAGRTAWNEQDYSIACEIFNRLWPTCMHGAHQGECYHCDQEEDTPSSPRNRRSTKLQKALELE